MHLDNRLTVTQCLGHANIPGNECEGVLAKKVIPCLYLRTYPQPLQNMQCHHYFIAPPREAGGLQRINYHHHSILTIFTISKTNKKYLATSSNAEWTMHSMEVLSQIHSHRAYRLPMQRALQIQEHLTQACPTCERHRNILHDIPKHLLLRHPWDRSLQQASWKSLGYL